MNRSLLAMLVVLQVAGVCAGREYRDFTDTKGRTIRGCVVGYDGKSGVVTFERDNHRTAKVPITVFSEADRVYIRNWECGKNFLSDRKFKISAQRKEVKDKEESYKSSSKSKKVENMGYEIVLENRANAALDDIEIEYCIYYEQDEIRKHKQLKAEGVYCGSFPETTLAPRSKRKMYTKSVKIYKEELSAGWIYSDGMDNVQRGRVRGIWIRAKMKLPSGNTLIRDYCLPDSLANSKAWMTSSVDVGMN